MKKSFLILFIITDCFFAGCAFNSSLMKTGDHPKRWIRVAIIQQVPQFDLSVHGPFEIRDAITGRLLYGEGRANHHKVSKKDGMITAGNFVFREDRIKVIPRRPSSIYVNNRRFRGYIEIINENKGLLVVNHLGLEQYVKGVLYHEVSPRWPIEALKAQAVAVRTYALYRSLINAQRPYDVRSDIYSQVYGGRSSERYRTNLAVDRTKTLVLTYKGQIFPSYYHADSGGYTENVREMWNEDWSPLRGRRDPFSRGSPHSHWKKNFRLKDIQDKLNKAGYALWLIKDIKVIERNKSGRIRKLRITDRKGKCIEISGKKFRHLIGPNVIKSNNYRIVMEGYYFDLIGTGWGHGVGMSQWGARAMAKRGFCFKEILKFYYPGAEIISYEALGL